MAVLRNNCGATITFPGGMVLRPGEYIVRNEDVMQSHEYRDIIQPCIARGELAQYNMEGLKLDEYPPWIERHYTMFLHCGVKLRPSTSTEPWQVLAEKIHDYLVQTLPHKNINIIYGSQHYAISCIPEITSKIWARVIKPELKRVANEEGIIIRYAIRETNSKRIDIVLYYVWDALAAVVAPIAWQEVDAYNDFRKFGTNLESFTRGDTDDRGRT